MNCLWCTLRNIPGGFSINISTKKVDNIRYNAFIMELFSKKMKERLWADVGWCSSTFSNFPPANLPERREKQNIWLWLQLSQLVDPNLKLGVTFIKDFYWAPQILLFNSSRYCHKILKNINKIFLQKTFFHKIFQKFFV